MPDLENGARTCLEGEARNRQKKVNGRLIGYAVKDEERVSFGIGTRRLRLC
jgi:hypothetical protein